MASRYLKRCSASLIIREIQIKTSVVYHLTLIKMSLIRNTRDNKCCQKDLEKREHLCTAGEDVHWCTCYRKQYGVSSKDEK